MGGEKMKPYLAVGIRTDVAGNVKVYADGNTPKDARLNLQRRHLHLLKVFTMYVPREERRKWQKKLENNHDQTV
jgi:hypothetical protein